jgi:hypothetical protein
LHWTTPEFGSAVGSQKTVGPKNNADCIKNDYIPNAHPKYYGDLESKILLNKNDDSLPFFSMHEAVVGVSAATGAQRLAVVV